MIQMGQHHIIAARRQGRIKHNGPNLLGMWVRQASGTRRPTAGQRRQPEYRTLRPLRIGPQPGQGGFQQRWLPGQLQTGLHYVQHMLWCQLQFVLGFLQLVHQLFELFAQLPLEFQQPPYRFRFAFGLRGIQATPFPEHGLFDLGGNHRADLAQILTDGLDLERRPHQKLQIRLQRPDLAAHLRLGKARADEVINLHFVGFLAVAIHPPVALLHPIGIPGNFIMNQPAAIVLQVQTFRGGIGRQQNPHRRIFGISLKRCFNLLPVVVGHSAVNHQQPAMSGEALMRQQIVQPILSRPVLGEQDHPLAVPVPVRAQVHIQPADQGLRLAIRPLSGLIGIAAQGLQQRLFLKAQARQRPAGQG